MSRLQCSCCQVAKALQRRGLGTRERRPRSSAQRACCGLRAFLRAACLYGLLDPMLSSFSRLCAPKDWYAEALLAMLGIPLPPPPGAQPRHALDPAILLQAPEDPFKLSSC